MEIEGLKKKIGQLIKDGANGAREMAKSFPKEAVKESCRAQAENIKNKMSQLLQGDGEKTTGSHVPPDEKISGENEPRTSGQDVPPIMEPRAQDGIHAATPQVSGEERSENMINKIRRNDGSDVPEKNDCNGKACECSGAGSLVFGILAIHFSGLPGVGLMQMWGIILVPIFGILGIVLSMKGVKGRCAVPMAAFWCSLIALAIWVILFAMGVFTMQQIRWLLK